MLDGQTDRINMIAHLLLSNKAIYRLLFENKYEHENLIPGKISFFTSYIKS